MHGTIDSLIFPRRRGASRYRAQQMAATPRALCHHLEGGGPTRIPIFSSMLDIISKWILSRCSNLSTGYVSDIIKIKLKSSHLLNIRDRYVISEIREYQIRDVSSFADCGKVHLRTGL
jgi:hypothetical protein